MSAAAQTGSLAGQTIVMSGGSRGIGLAIATRAAQDGANLVLLAKTDTPHPKLPGTIHTAVDQIIEAGGRAIGVVGDVRDDAAIEQTIAAAVDAFGGIDVVVNNASVIDLRGSAELPSKSYDLMQDVNVRGTYQLSRAALPYLLASPRPAVLSLAPPVTLDPRWLGAHPGYTTAKFGMALVTLGLAAEFADQGIAASTLWPRTTIQTAAVANVLGGDELLRRSRTPQIYADAAHLVLSAERGRYNGRALIVEDVLAEHGITELSAYSPGVDQSELYPDIFL